MSVLGQGSPLCQPNRDTFHIFPSDAILRGWNLDLVDLVLPRVIETSTKRLKDTDLALRDSKAIAGIVVS